MKPASYNLPRALYAALAVAALSVAQAPASSVDNLFDAEVEVTDQGDAQRGQAFAAALWDVLVKVTGDRTVPALPEVQTLFRRADKLVQQFRYEEIEQVASTAAGEGAAPADDPLNFDVGVDADVDVDGGAGEPAPSHRLWVRFAPDTIERQLNRLGVPLWGRERPETLVWLAVEDGPHRYLLGANSRSEVREELLTAARQRGVPVLLPVMDVADRRAVRFADVRGNFVQPVWDASRRYNVTSILAGNLIRTASGAWQSQWTLHRRGGTSSWRVQSAARPGGLLSGVEGVASILSRELAVGYYGSGVEHVQLTVHEVNATGEYARVLAYLRSLSLVKEVMVQRINEGRVTFAMRLRGNPEDLRRTIALGDTLTAVRNPGGDDNPHRVLQYAHLP